MLSRRRARACAAAVVAGATLLSGIGASGSASAALAAAPEVLYPTAAEAGRSLKNVELRWQPVEGATGYEVQISDTGLFGAGTYTATTAVERFAAPVALPAGELAWRVRATTAAGRTAWSVPEPFTRGWSQRPANARTTGEGVLPAFRWDPLPDASYYEIEISKVPHDALDAESEGTREHYTCFTTHTYLAPYGVVTGSSLENPPGSAKGCAFDVTEAKPTPGEPYKLNGGFELDTTYYWRVRGRDGNVDERTTRLAAAEGACTGQWVESGVTGAEGAATLPIGGTAPKYDATPECSDWAEGDAFVVELPEGDVRTPLVAAPGGLQVQPSNDPSAPSTTVTDTPLFAWEPVPGALKYRVYVTPKGSAKDNQRVWETYGNSLMPLGSVRDNALGSSWQVQACNFDADCGPRSAVHSFRKVSATTTAPLSTKGDRGPTILTWSVQEPDAPAPDELVAPALQAKAYEVQVARAGEFARAEGAEEDPVLAHQRTVDRIADADDATTSSLVLDRAALPQGTYQWRVRPVDQTGQPDLAWSLPSQAFRVDWTAPTVRIDARAGFTGKALRIASTEEVTGVDGASVQVVAESTGAAVPGTITSLGAASTASTGSTAWTFSATTPFVAGERYSLRVDGDVVTDLSENTAVTPATTVQASKTLDSSDPGLVAVVGDARWSTVTASDAVGRSFLRSSDAPATPGAVSGVRGTVRGTKVWVYGCLGPKGGIVDVLVDGRSVGKVNLWRSYSGCGRVFVAPTALRDGQHLVEVRATGTKDKRSTGYLIDVDAIAVA